MDESDSMDRVAPLRRVAEAAAAEAKSISIEECRSLWRALMDGQCQIVSEFCTEKGSFLVLRWNESWAPHRFKARAQEILERTLLGCEQKVVSSELGVSSSTVTSTLKCILHRLGLRCVPSKIPLLLVMLANAANGNGSFDDGLGAGMVHAGLSHLVLYVPISEQRLTNMLSPAEGEVIRMRLQGRSHAEIAASRQTSMRTVANQLANATHRLGISGRLELMRLVVHPESVRRSRPQRALRGQRRSKVSASLKQFPSP